MCVCVCVYACVRACVRACVLRKWFHHNIVRIYICSSKFLWDEIFVKSFKIGFLHNSKTWYIRIFKNGRLQCPELTIRVQHVPTYTWTSDLGEN